MLNAAKHYSHITLREEPAPYRVTDSERGVHAASTSNLQATAKRPEGRAPLTPAEHRAAIAAAAQALNALRERWLNPPEWTVEKFLEFPGSVNGPWARYLDHSTIQEVGRVTPCAPSGMNPDASVGRERRAADCPPYLVGTVRYPRLEPRNSDCAAKLKKRTLTNLYNERPAWLDLAHKKLDAAVAAAYGFTADLTEEQILEKLLALNLERAAKIEKGEAVTASGVPKNYPDAKKLVKEDCIQPANLS